MKEIIIIGTLHGGWTPKNELEEVLGTINPDNVLVELSSEELNDRPREDSIRDEMFAAYDWAVKNNKKVSVFDIENSTLKEGVTGKESDFVELENQVKELLGGYSWKSLNNTEPWNISTVTELENAIVEKYFDTAKMKERDFKMLENIKGLLVEGKNVVVTGTGHLTFFNEQIPGAQLFFRN